MAHVISDECVSCGACAAQCPVEAITVDDVAQINNEICIDCGATFKKGRLAYSRKTPCCYL